MLMKHISLPFPSRALLPHLALICLIFSSARPACAAENVVLGMGSATVTNVRYQLEDLDLSDGVAPAIQFSSDFKTTMRFDHGIDPGEETATLPGRLEDDISGSFTSSEGFGVVTRSLNDFSAEVMIHVSDATGPLMPRPFVGATLGKELGAYIFTGDNLGNFALSPHTRLVINGNIRGDNSLDLSPLIDNSFMSGDQPIYSNMTAVIISEAGVTIVGPERAYATDFQMSIVQGTVSKDGAITFPTDPSFMGLPRSFDRPFSVQLENTSDQAINGYINVRASIQVGIHAVPAVPEPTTWGLMLAGACVLAARRRPRNN